jgi:hypothetical protein
MKKVQSLIKPKYLLILVFVLIVLFEAYLLYLRVYHNLYTEVSEVQAGNVVRLDLAAYNKTLETLDASKNFFPQTPALANPNPFK